MQISEDVQLIGLDGTKLMGEDYVCSVIVQPVAEISEMCVEILLRENMPVKPPLVCLPVSYAYGGTTSERLEGQG